jgi:glyoxylase-like metal-dependent hydrolase (beta-lactamase superfamily II)
MFGAVPKGIWERCEEVDLENRIGLVARVLYLRDEARRVLIDAGLGEKFGSREGGRFAISSTPAAQLPFRWEDLTHVVLTHLHFDHAGGITARQADPSSAPRFRVTAPRARIYLQKRNWELAQSPGPRERASYLPENVEPLRSSNLELLEAEAEALPGLIVHPSDGHTRGMQWVTLGRGRNALAFPADLVPTRSHLHLPFVMGYDMCVETLLREKEAFLRQAEEEGWIVVFAHDRIVPAARIGRGADGKFQVKEVIEL